MKNPKKRHIKKMIAQGVKKLKAVLPLGQVHFGVNPQSTPEERAERFRRSMPEGYSKHEDAREHEAALRRPNPLREHWERFGDPYEGRIPAKDIDHTLLAIKPTPEMKAELERIKDQLKPIFVDGVRVDNPEEDKE